MAHWAVRHARRHNLFRLWPFYRHCFYRLRSVAVATRTKATQGKEIMSDMQRISAMLSLPCLDSEDAEIAAAMGCFLSCLRTLFELRFLVRSADLDGETRQNLMDGLDHIEDHLVQVARRGITEKRNRKN